MTKLTIKQEHKTLRKNRIRSTVKGTVDRPRLSINISIKNISAQLIDDDKMQKITQASTVGLKKDFANMTLKAEYIGQEIAKKALKANHKKIVFDRNGKLYHGRVKALADSARAAGLEF